jgi:hypothetical protein
MCSSFCFILHMSIQLYSLILWYRRSILSDEFITFGTWMWISVLDEQVSEVDMRSSLLCVNYEDVFSILFYITYVHDIVWVKCWHCVAGLCVHARVSDEMQCTVRVMVRTGYSTSKIDEFINVVVICIGMLMVWDVGLF